jgi:pSer/pThr/pTyr-binding forkhead associated (FHA) protein
MIDVEITARGESYRFQLADGEHSVGRSSDNSVSVPFTMISKKHAILRVDGSRLWVRDVGSTNGTEINGEPVGMNEIEVTPGKLVSFAAWAKSSARVTRTPQSAAQANRPPSPPGARWPVMAQPEATRTTAAAPSSWSA